MTRRDSRNWQEKHADILFEEEKDCLKRDQEKYMQFLQGLIKDASGLASQTPEQLAFTIQFAGINESASLAFNFRDLAANVAVSRMIKNC